MLSPEEHPKQIDILEDYRDLSKVEPKYQSRCELVSVIDHDDLDFQIPVAQNRDARLKERLDELEKGEVVGYELIDGLVFRKLGNNSLFCVPTELQDNVIRMVHEKIGHLGVDKCYDQIRKYYWFDHMRDKIERFTRNCIKCILYSAPVRCNEHNMFSIPKKPVPFDTLHLDHFGPLPAIRSKRKHILIAIDAFTKFVKLYPVNSTSTKEVCCALEKYFGYYSRPRRIITDRGSCFTLLDFSNFLLKRNITHLKVAVASPQANSQVERVNRVVKAMLSKLTDSLEHLDWPAKLSQSEYAINNTVHSTTKHTPSELLFGVTQRGCIVDGLTEFLEDKLSHDTPRDLEGMREAALRKI